MRVSDKMCDKHLKYTIVPEWKYSGKCTTCRIVSILTCPFLIINSEFIKCGYSCFICTL